MAIKFIEEPASKIRFIDDKPKIKFLDEPLSKKAFEAVTQPLPKTLGMKSPSEFTEPTSARLAFEGKPVQSFLSGLMGDTANIATTPLTYVPIPGAKLLGKIPLMGTTVGRIAKLPVGKGFVESAKELGRLEQTLKATTPLSSRGVSPAQRIITALKDAKPIRAEQERLYSAERTRRAGEIESIGKEKRGESGYYSQLSALKGGLPKAQFEGIRSEGF